MAIFPEYVTIRYLATFQDNASAKAQATAKRIQAAEAETTAASLSNYQKTALALNNVGRAAATTGRLLTTYVTLPILGVGAASVKMATDYQAAIAKVSGLTGASQKQINQWSRQLQGLSRDVGVGPTQLADSLYFVASAGLKVSDVLPVVRKSAQIAATGMADAATAGDLLTSVLNAYGHGAISAAQATDVFVNTIKYGKAEPSELAASLGRVVAPAAQLGVTFDQVGASIASMSDLGLDASESVTALRQVLVELLKPSAGANETIKSLGFTAEGLRQNIGEKGLLNTLNQLRVAMGGVGLNTDKLRQVVSSHGLQAGIEYLNKNSATLSDTTSKVFPNIRALVGFLLLTGKNAGQTASIFNHLANSTGAMAHAMDVTRQTALFKFHRAWADFQVTLIQVGKLMLPTVTEIITAVGHFVAQFKGLDPATQRLIIQAGLLVAALGPLLYIFGQLTLTLTAVGALFVESPILIVAMAAAAATAGLVISGKLNNPLQATQEIMDDLHKLWPTFKEDATTALRAVASVASAVGNVTLDLLRLIVDILNGDWSQAWAHASDAVGHFSDGVQAAISGIRNLIPDMFDLWKHSLTTFVTGVGLALIAWRRLSVFLIGNPLFSRAGAGAALSGGAAGDAGLLGAIGASSLVGRARRSFAMRSALRAGPAEMTGVAGLSQDISTGRYRAGGRFLSMAEGDRTVEALLAGQTLAMGRTTAAAGGLKTGLMGLVNFLGGPWVVGLAGAGIGLYALTQIFDNGKSAADHLHDSLVRIKEDQTAIRDAARGIGTIGLSLEASRLSIKQYDLELENYHKQLDKLKPGTTAYKEMQLEISQVENARRQTLIQLNSAQKDFNDSLDTAIQKGRDLLNSHPQQSLQRAIGTAMQSGTQGAFLQAPRRELIDQVVQMIRHGNENAGRIMAALGDRNKVGRFELLQKEDVANLILGYENTRKLTGTIQQMTRSWIEARRSGIDPTIKSMQELRRVITANVAQQTGLPARQAQQLSAAAGAPLGLDQAQMLQQIGGISQGVIQLAGLLHHIPSIQEIKFVSNLPTEMIPAAKEFAAIAHRLPSRQVLNIISNFGPAGTALAAYVAKNRDALAHAKNAQKQIQDVGRQLRNVPQFALEAITGYIERFGRLPKKLDEFINKIKQKRQELANQNQQLFSEMKAAQLEHETTGRVSQATRASIDQTRENIRKLSHSAQSEANKRQNHIKFQIDFTGGLGRAGGANLANKLTTTLQGVSVDVGNNLQNDRTFATVGREITQGIGQGAGSNQGATDVSSKVNTALDKAKRQVRTHIGAQSPSRIWRLDVGLPIIQGVAAGVKDGQGLLNTAIETTINGALSFAKSHLKISSPSQLAASALGYPIAQGIAAGIRRGRGLIGQAIQHVVQSAVSKQSQGLGGGGGGAGFAGGAASGAAQSYARAQLARYGWGPDQWGPLQALWTRESGWNYRAENPSSGAYGIPQALPASKMASAGSDWRTNYRTQINWGLGYIHGRYGSPAAAWAHEQSIGWYANGGFVPGPYNSPQVIVAHGGELIVPTSVLGGGGRGGRPNPTSGYGSGGVGILPVRVVGVDGGVARGYLPPPPPPPIKGGGGGGQGKQSWFDIFRESVLGIGSHGFESGPYAGATKKEIADAIKKMANMIVMSGVRRVEAVRKRIQDEIAALKEGGTTKQEGYIIHRLQQSLEAINSALARKIHGFGLAHAQRYEKHAEDMIRKLRQGGISKSERDEFENLQRIVRLAGSRIIQLLTRRMDLLTHRLTISQQDLSNMELRQELAGTAGTPSAAQAQSSYIRSKIIPVLEQQLKNLKQQEKEQQEQGHRKRAREIAEEIHAKIGEILQAQLDAQNAIKDATQQTAQELGSTSISFGYQNQQWTLGQVALGTGA